MDYALRSLKNKNVQTSNFLRYEMILFLLEVIHTKTY